MCPDLCEHLLPLKQHLLSRGLRITGAGQPWTENCRLWITFDAVLDCERLLKTLGLVECVTIHENADPRSGLEKGLVCSVHHDGVIGIHPSCRPDAPGVA